MTKYKRDLRLAKGTKFDLIIDSFLYAVALATHPDDDVIIASKGCVFLLRGDLTDKIAAVARAEGVKESMLKFTEDEKCWLELHRGVVILEDEYGRCEVEYHLDGDDAKRQFEEFRGIEAVEVSGTTVLRTLRQSDDPADVEVLP